MAYPGERTRDRYRQYQINTPGPQKSYEQWKADTYKKEQPKKKPKKEEKSSGLRRYESGRYG